MKFKDKDGNVFEDIVKAHTNFCRGKRCGECGLNMLDAPHCVYSAIVNPAEAALMPTPAELQNYIDGSVVEE